MQFTLFASLAILCSAALAAPSERRDGSDTLAEVIAYVDHDLNDVTVDVLKRGSDDNTLAEIIAYVDHDLNDVTVDVLKRDDALIKVIADVQDDLDNLTVKVLTGRDDGDDDGDSDDLTVKPEVLTGRDDALIKVIADVQDDLDNLTVKVLTPSRRDNVDLVDVEAYVDNVLNNADIEVL